MTIIMKMSRALTKESSLDRYHLILHREVVAGVVGLLKLSI